VPLAGHGLHPTALRRPASRPQLKRDPLGRSQWEDILKAFFLAATAALIVSERVRGQDTTLPSIRDPYPDWVSDDTNLVNTDWAPGTITKNTLLVMFTPGSSAEARAAAVRAVHGMAIQGDSTTYVIRVASHPNACAVEQAISLLRTLPQVATAAPQMFWAMDHRGDLLKVHGAAKVSATPCPSGYGLLK